MSVETVTMIGTAVAVIGALFAGFAWMIRQMDIRLGALETRLSGRMGALEKRLSARIDKVDQKIDGVQREVTEVKIAVARLEGPQRHLVSVR